MDEKKNGSQALETTGTALSAITNISTSSTVYQGESFAKAEMDAVNIVVETARSSGGLHMRSLGELADEVVRTMRDIVESVNIPAQHGGRNLGWSKPKTISAVQAAMLVFEYERIRMVCTKETVRKPTAEGVLAMYVDSGKDVGISKIIRALNPSSRMMRSAWSERTKLHSTTRRTRSLCALPMILQRPRTRVRHGLTETSMCPLRVSLSAQVTIRPSAHSG